MGIETRGLDAAVVGRWAELAVAGLDGDREAIDRINVYPVADGDTGTNLLHTARAAAGELDPSESGAGGACAALARGALAGARGNSGMLLSQVLRGFAEGLRDVDEGTGEEVREALGRASVLAGRAVADPAPGTLLSVLEAAVRGASACTSDRLGDVVREATAEAARALEETPSQLAALAEAGVVDAGGRGLVVVLDALHAAVHDGQRLAPEPPRPGADRVQHHDSRYAYEVMYRIDSADAEAAARLRAALGGVGDCVSVLSDGSCSWAVHVHCDDVGPAIEFGIEVGRVRDIRVVRFADQLPQAADAVLACVRGQELGELFRGEGAAVLPAGQARRSDDLLRAVEATGAGHVVVLPNDPAVTPLAEEAAARAVRGGREVVVVPTASPVQGLAALAVRDPERRRADDVVAMAEAAAATRRGELVVAAEEALTWSGRCQPGDVLGLVDGEVVLIGDELAAAARELADRMLAVGGELVTAVVDAGTPEAVLEQLVAHLRRGHPEVEVNSYPGGALEAALLLGVE